MSQVIIIPVHNQYQYLQKCLDSIMLHTEKPIVIIVDDGSDEDTVEFIKDYATEFGGYVVLRNEEALGFSAACNKGIEYAMKHFNFTCLCLLNSDTEVMTPNWFEKVEECFLTDESVYIAGAMSSNALTQTVKNEAKYLKAIDDKPILYAGIIHGFCYFISKDCIKKNGGFDVAMFPHYGSEDDYTVRALESGGSSIIAGNVYVRHYAEKSYTSSLRNKIIKTTLPALLKRWGSKKVMEYSRATERVCNFLNN